MPADDVLVMLADKTTEIYKNKGFSPTGWSNQGELAQGGEKRFSLTLAGGNEFQVIGLCDNSCGDINLVLTRFSGEQESSDVADDDVPIVKTGRAGMYSVTVTMVKCSGMCRYTLLGFSK